MGASALIFIYWLTTVRQLHTRLILVGVIGTHLIAILLAGSRAAFISLIAASAIFLLLQFSLNDYELYVPTVIRDLATGGTIALGILIAALPIIDITEVRAIRRTLRIIYTGETETALLARFDHVGSSVELWIQSPLFGHGIGSYGVLFWGEDIVAYPHNIILEVLSELGLIGLLLFGTIVVLSLSRLYLFYNFLPKNMGSFLVSFILFWFISSLFSFDMTGNRYLFMSLALGYVSAGIYCSKENGVQCSDRQYSYENSK
ncbi:O-antigen ligase family protein [Natronorubrum texcoconense]|nr:O-antigen ligase family protein [Natronorubrum texcoconense]